MAGCPCEVGIGVGRLVGEATERGLGEGHRDGSGEVGTHEDDHGAVEGAGRICKRIGERPWLNA